MITVKQHQSAVENWAELLVHHTDERRNCARNISGNLERQMTSTKTEQLNKYVDITSEYNIIQF